jgi:hypothetical protein
MNAQIENTLNTSKQQQWNELATSLLDFSAASLDIQDDFIDYMSEHLYIQLHIAGRCENSGEIDSSNKKFFTACQKVYYAEDEQSRRDAIQEARLHLAA